MKETIRCCISCILPCGALDVIRIVHASGRVEEISRRSVVAADILQAYPKHVLRKPPSPSSFDAVGDAGGGPPAAVVLPPNAELQRGKIYFLMPVSSSAAAAGRAPAGGSPGRRRRRKKRAEEGNGVPLEDRTKLLLSDRYLSEILSESKAGAASTQRDARRGRVAVWRPRLQSIEEVGNDATA